MNKIFACSPLGPASELYLFTAHISVLNFFSVDSPKASTNDERDDFNFDNFFYKSTMI